MKKIIVMGILSVALLTGCSKKETTIEQSFEPADEVVIAKPTESPNFDGLMADDETVEEPVQETKVDDEVINTDDEVINAVPGNEFEYESEGVKIWVTEVSEGQKYERLDLQTILDRTLDLEKLDDCDDGSVAYWGEDSGVTYHMSRDDFYSRHDAYVAKLKELGGLQEVDSSVDDLPLGLQTYAQRRGTIWATYKEDTVNGPYSNGIANSIDAEMPRLLVYVINKCAFVNNFTSAEFITGYEEYDGDVVTIRNVLISYDGGNYYEASWYAEDPNWDEPEGATISPITKEDAEDFYGISL